MSWICGEIIPREYSKIQCGIINWIYPALDGDQWQALAK
jgi:hypothetical protein